MQRRFNDLERENTTLQQNYERAIREGDEIARVEIEKLRRSQQQRENQLLQVLVDILTTLGN